MINVFDLSADIITAVECGVDVFDSSCVYMATERGCAFTYSNERINPSRQDEGRDSGTAGDCGMESMPFEIDLNDDK